MYRKTLLATIICFFSIVSLGQAEVISQSLPTPNMAGGKSLMQCLQARKSTREFGRRAVNEQTLADLLWVAVGVNRQNGKRTIPTALNSQKIDVFVLKYDGVWLYKAQAHKLIKVSDKDLRAFVAEQDYAKEAALDLIYVSNSDAETEGAMYAGAAYQNVGLYCASKGLNNVVRAYFDRDGLRKELSLCDNQKIIISQAIGWPKK